MPVPNIFGTATSAIPLSQLDTNFATPVTIGNTAVQLGNTVTSFGNVTLTNVTISSGNVTVSAGSNTAPSITTVGDTNTGIYFPAADTIAFSEGGVESMRIDSAGNVGIGTSSPATALHVTGVSRTQRIGSANAFEWYVSSTNRYFLTDVTNAAERLCIDNAGNVGIGTSSPGGRLQVAHDTDGLARAFVSNPNTGTSAAAFMYTSTTDNRYLSFLVGGANRTGTTAGLSNASLAEIQGGSDNSALLINQGGATPIVFANNATERMRIDSSGNLQVQTGAVMPYAPAPASISGAATLTNANIRAQIINTTGTTYTVTMALGTTLETLASWATTGIGYDFYIVNTASGTITLDATEVGVTSVGTMTIATGVSAQFRIRRTAANTFVVYRLG
jgi:hypothetical protein